MGTTVQIDLELDVYERLQALASPFVDTPSSTIRGLLDGTIKEKKQLDRKKDEEIKQSETTAKQAYYRTSRSVLLPLGPLQATYGLRGSSKTLFEAEVTLKGIEFDGKVFDDPSPAARHAKILAGAKGGTASTNGWEFWKYFDENRQKWDSISFFQHIQLR